MYRYSNRRGTGASGIRFWLHAVASTAALGLLAGPAPAIDVIQGDWQFKYEDSGGRTQPVRLGQVTTFDQQPDGSNTYREIGPNGTSGPFPMIVTGLDGKASAKLENFEAGGIDPAAQMSTATGTGSVTVTMNFVRADGGKGANYYALSPAIANVQGNFSAPPMTVQGPATDTGRAFAAFDALVTGKRYLEYLGSQAVTIDGVLGTDGVTSVNQPASKDQRIFQLNVGLNNRAGYAGSTGSDAFDWDVLLHEVGHATSFANGFNSFPIPGGNHSFSGVLDPKLAWSEGFSDFFQGAAQDWENRQPGLERLPDVAIGAGAGQISIRSTIATYTDTVDADVSWDLNKKGTLAFAGKKASEAGGADNEIAVARILWDLFDGTGASKGALDKVTVGHKTLFDLLVGSAAKTLGEFADYLAKKFPDARARADIGAIFATHGAASRALAASQPAAPPLPPPVPAAVNALAPAGAAAANTPAKEAGDAPYYPDPLPDMSVPSFRLGTDPAPTLSWLAPWGSSSPSTESYRIQFFRPGPTLTDSPFGIPDYSDGNDWTPEPSLQLLAAVDLSGTGSGTAFDECGQPDELGYRCFQLDPAFLQELLLAAGSPGSRIYWDVVGPNDGSALDAGIWGNALAFDLVPEPGSLGLTALMLAATAWLIRRRADKPSRDAAFDAVTAAWPPAR